MFFLKPFLIFSLFSCFLFVGSNTLFATETQNLGNNTNIISSQNIKTATSQKSVADFIWSLITPNEACAATDVVSCVDSCEELAYMSGGVCCKQWAENTPEGCDAMMGCQED